MSAAGTGKSKSGNLEAKQEDRDEGRRTNERDKQQDLNQGTSTGTHDTVRRGVDWGTSYQGRTGEKHSDPKENTANKPAKKKNLSGAVRDEKR